MTQETYQSLTAKEKLMYDELSAFSKRLAERQDEIVELLQTIIAMGTEDA